METLRDGCCFRHSPEKSLKVRGATTANALLIYLRFDAVAVVELQNDRSGGLSKDGDDPFNRFGPALDIGRCSLGNAQTGDSEHAHAIQGSGSRKRHHSIRRSPFLFLEMRPLEADDPFAWLSDVPPRIVALPITKLEELLPHCWAQARA